MTPAKLVLGYELPRVGDWKVPQYREEREEPQSYEDRPREANENQEMYRERYATGKAPKTTFEVGDMVLARALPPPKSLHKPMWMGPHRVAKKISEEVYEVEKEDSRPTIHVDDLRRAPAQRDEEEEDDGDEQQGDERPDDDQQDAEGGIEGPIRVNVRGTSKC